MSAQAQIRERITAEIVAALERGGLPPWRRPWGTSGPPANATTGRPYSGVNVLLVALHRQRLGLTSSRYATFAQWHEKGCRVKARPPHVPSGRWGCNLVFCKPVTKKPKDTGEDDDRTGEYLLLRSFTVFGADQVEGEVADRLRAEHLSREMRFIDYAPAEEAATATGADIRHGSDRAFYCRPTADGTGDYVTLPHKYRFESEREYYSTLFHELGHWSECRLKWAGSYAEGELRAEMAAAFILAELGVPQSDDLTNHNTYLDYWLRAMKADPRFLLRVCSDASRAVDLLLSFSRQPRAESEELAAV